MTITTKPTVVFWSSIQKKSFEFANQKQFENFNWQNFNKGDEVFVNDEIIGKVKMVTENKIWITDIN